MKYVRTLVIFAVLFAFCAPAVAQWQVPNGAIPVGRGAGATGFGSVAGSSGTGLGCLVDTMPPTFGACTSSLAVGTTPVVNGTNGYALYNLAGVLANSPRWPGNGIITAAQPNNNSFLVPWSLYDQTGAPLPTGGTTTGGAQEFFTACAKPDSAAAPGWPCIWNGGQEPPANGGGARIIVPTTPLAIGPTSGKKLDFNSTSVFPPVATLGASPLLTINSQIMADFKFGGVQILNNRGTGPSILFSPTSIVQTVAQAILDSNFDFTTVGNVLFDTASGPGGIVVSNLKIVELNADRLAVCAVTVTNASPAVVTCPGGSPVVATHVQFAGTLPTGIVAGTTYFVSSAGRTGTTYQIADTELHAVAGTNSVNTSSASSGVTATAYQQSPYGFRATAAGSNISFNNIDIAHLHDVGPGTDAFQWGTAAVPGGINASGNFFKLRISTNNTTANGIHTTAPGNFYLASIDGITTGKSILFEAGACNNIVINPFNSAPSTITDVSGCAGNDNQGNIIMRQGRITIGGQLVPTIAGAIPAGHAWVSDSTTLTATDGGTYASSVSNADGSLIISPTAGAVVASMNPTPSLVKTQAAPSLFGLQNVNTGTAALTAFQAQNSANLSLFGIGGTGYTGTPLLQNRAFVFGSAGSAGIAISNGGANPILFGISNAEVGRWSPAVPGELDLGLSATTGGQLKMYGSTSGSGNIKFPAAAGSGTLTLPAGTTDFSATGGTSQFVKQASLGAPFTVAQPAAADLSDYVTSGTWTPTLAFGGASVGIAYSARAGTYRKVGKIVTVQFFFTLTSKGSSTGSASITGLPFTSDATASSSNVGFLYLDAATGVTGSPFGIITPSGNSIILQQSTGSATSLADTNFSAATTCVITISYQTT